MNPACYNELTQYYHQFRTCPHKNNFIASISRKSLGAIDDLPILKVSITKFQGINQPISKLLHNLERK